MVYPASLRFDGNDSQIWVGASCLSFQRHVQRFWRTHSDGASTVQFLSKHDSQKMLLANRPIHLAQTTLDLVANFISANAASVANLSKLNKNPP